MYCVAVMSPMSWPRGLVELTYPLVRLDWPRPYFSRNRGSFRMANALNVRSTDWQNVQSVIPTEGWRRPTRRRGRVLGGRASVRGQLSARSRCALRSRGHERRALRPRARDGMANPPLRAKFPTLRGGGGALPNFFPHTRVLRDSVRGPRPHRLNLVCMGKQSEVRAANTSGRGAPSTPRGPDFGLPRATCPKAGTHGARYRTHPDSTRTSLSRRTSRSALRAKHTLPCPFPSPPPSR